MKASEMERHARWDQEFRNQLAQMSGAGEAPVAASG
jgi:hypothetical protein